MYVIESSVGILCYKHFYTLLNRFAKQTISHSLQNWHADPPLLTSRTRDIPDIVVAFYRCERPREPAPSKLICPSLPAACNPRLLFFQPAVTRADHNCGSKQMRANVWLTRNYIHLAVSSHFVAALYRQFVAGRTRLWFRWLICVALVTTRRQACEQWVVTDNELCLHTNTFWYKEFCIYIPYVQLQIPKHIK